MKVLLHVYITCAGMKKYEHRGRQWHAECFVCMVCHQQIGTNSFIPRANDIVCVPCYERQYSQSCTKCGLVSHRSIVLEMGMGMGLETTGILRVPQYLMGMVVTGNVSWEWEEERE